MHTFFENAEDRARMGKILLGLGMAAALFFGMRFINEIKTFGTIGQAESMPNTVTVTGTGEAFAIPDVATLGFAVQQKGKTIKEAQEVVTAKTNEVLAFLTEAGIAEKDVKTVDYSVYPEYTYPRPCYTAPCPSEEPQLNGYTVRQGFSVKIRNTENLGNIVEGVSTRGITTMTGPDFTVDDLDTVQAEARKNAIEEAKVKAKVLAKDLDVRLVRIASFSEDNSGGYYPMPAAKMEGYGYGGAGDASVTVPAGENKYTSTVYITYEIR